MLENKPVSKLISKYKYKANNFINKFKTHLKKSEIVNLRVGCHKLSRHLSKAPGKHEIAIVPTETAGDFESGDIPACVSYDWL